MDQTNIDIHEALKSPQFYQTHSNPLIKEITTLFDQHVIGFDLFSEKILNLGSQKLKLGMGLIGHITGDNYLIINTNSDKKDNRISKGMILSLNNTLSKQVAYQYETCYSDSVDTDPAFHTNPASYKGYVKKYIACPIFQNHIFFGTISFSDSDLQTNKFTIEEIEFVEELANIISLAISSKGFPVIQTPPPFSNEERFLFDSLFNKSLISMTKVSLTGELLEINYSMTQLLGYSASELFNNSWKALSDENAKQEDRKNAKLLLSGKQDCYQICKKFNHKNGSIIYGLVTVTLIRDQADEPCFFISYIQDITEQETTRLELFKRKEQLEQLNQQLQQQVKIDHLTQIYNRGHAIDTLEKELRRSTRNNLPVAVILIDVDYFKQYNDEFGHLSGDKALISIAQNLKSNCRDTDTVARFGGEEFVIILPETPLQAAAQVAESLRSSVCKITELDRDVTISLGVTAWEVYEEELVPTTEKLLGLADEALYASKRQGRNQVSQKELTLSQAREA